MDFVPVRKFALLFFAIFFPLLAHGQMPLGPNCHQSPLESQTESAFVASCMSVCTHLLDHETDFNDIKKEEQRQKLPARCRSIAADQKLRESLTGKAQLFAKEVRWLTTSCLPSAAWEAVTAVPYLAYQVAGALWEELVHNHTNSPSSVNGSIPKEWANPEACDQSVECKRILARGLLIYQRMKPNGEWEIPDEQVDKEIANRSVYDIIKIGRYNRELARQECGRHLESARRRAFEPGLGMDQAAHRKVYDKIALEHPHCLSVLNLLPPELDPALQDSLANERKETPGNEIATLDKLMLHDVCFDRRLSMMICSDVLSALVPIGSAGTVTKSVAKVALVGGKTGRRGAKTNEVIRQGSTTVSPKSPAAARLVKDYKDRVFSSESENLAFISKVKSPGENTQFVVVENTMMKTLNTTIGNKDTVTALTNLHKSILLKNLDALKAKYPDIDFTIYNDFKSTNVALTSTKEFTDQARAQLRKDIDELLKATNREFGVEVRKLNITNTDVAGAPESWFKSGMDTNFDKTSFSAREARGSRELGLYEGNIDVNAVAYLHSVDSQRRAIAESPHFKELLDDSGLVPRPDVFGLTRQFSSPEVMAQAVRERYQITDFSTVDARLLMDYASNVDRFSPSILIAKREVLNLDDAVRGGMTFDVTGLGGENLHGTARSLISATSLDSAQAAARAAEERVSRELRRRLEKIREVAGPGTKCSGDDCVQITSKTMSLSDKARIVSKMANTPETKKIRMAFFGENVPEHARMQIASHGELIEKTLRKELSGKIDPRKLDDLVFGLDMQTTTANSGSVNLIVGRARGVSLSANEVKTLNEAFRRSLLKYNEDLREYQAGMLVTQERQIYLVPVPLSNETFESGE